MKLLESTARFVPVACVDLLTMIGVHATPRSGGDLRSVVERPDEHAAGIIDFSGEAMTGQIVFLSTFDFFASSRPGSGRGARLMPSSAADWLLVRDWSMELSNQLLGRVKNRLCTLGVTVETRLPRAVSGHSLLVTVRGRKTAHQAFRAGDHEVFVWFEATVREPEKTGPALEPVPEGKVIHF